MGLRDRFNRNKVTTSEYVGYSNNVRAGIRANNFVVSLSTCADEIALRIGRTDQLFTIILYDIKIEESLASIVSHPNTASAFLLSYGCEAKSSREFAVELRSLNPNIEFLELENGALSDFEMSIGPSVLQELKFQASPGLENIPKPIISVISSKPDPRFTETVEKLLQANIDVREVIQSSNQGSALVEAALSGALALVNFTNENVYPSGTYISPVINVASNSDFHKRIAADFDLGVSATPQEIVHRVQETIGRSPTASEIAGSFEPFGAILWRSEGFRVLSPVMNNFAKDLAHRYSIVGKKIAIGTGSEANEIATSKIEGYEIFTVADHGSLFALAEALTQRLQ
jgi:hypothetical protein